MALFPRQQKFASSINEKHHNISKFQKVILNDIDRGKGCRNCGDVCPGLQLHVWRKVCQYCSCPWECHDVEIVPKKRKPRLRSKNIGDRKGISFAATPEIIPSEDTNVTNNACDIKIVVEEIPIQTPESKIVEEIPIETPESKSVEEIPIETPESKSVEEIPIETPEIEIIVTEIPPEISEVEKLAQEVKNFEFEDPVQNSDIQENEEEVKNEDLPESPPSLVSPTDDAGEHQNLTPNSENENHDLSSLSETYLWYPLDMNKNNIENFMASIPPEYRPIKDTEAAQNCKSILLFQLPPQDTDYERCHPLSQKEIFLFEKFVEQREDKYRGQGIVKKISKGNCTSCAEPFRKDELCIFTPLVGNNYKYHINCFRCSKCFGFLQELHYYKKGKEIFCGRHHAELFGKRCAGCDEIIFADKITEAEDRIWHSEHFCCWYCDKPLGGDDYIKSRNITICNTCFTDQVNTTCFSCKKEVGNLGRVIKYREKSWHQKCFKCINCDRYLNAEKFIVKGHSIYCLDCFDETSNEIQPEISNSKCDVCLKPVDLHDPHMSSEGTIWHESCFICVFCNEDLTGKTFLRHKAGLLCEVCYGERIAHTCNQCNQKIIKGGVKHNQEFYHQDCFNCANCEIQLANIKFSTRDGKNFCFSCNKKFFAPPVCHQCSKEIKGKCFEFNKYNFHPECFKCTGCNKVIAGKEFYQTRGALYCKKCAKKKTSVVS